MSADSVFPTTLLRSMYVLPALLSGGLAMAQSAPSTGAPNAGPPPGGQQAGPPGMMAAVPEVDRSKDCDSACLRSHMDKYMAAMAKKDPATLEVTPAVRVAENSHALSLGDNAWLAIEKYSTNKVVFTDPFAGQVLLLTTVEMRAAEPFIYAVRLKIEKNRIAESEAMLTSDKIAGQHFRPDLMAETSKSLDVTIPAAKRTSRAELLKAARITWGLDAGAAIPNAKTCMHYENWETPLGGSPCRGGLGRDSRNVRIPLVDVEKGVVVNYQLQDAYDPQPRPAPPNEANGKTPIFYYRPLTFYVMQLARIAEGQVQSDQMFMNLQEIGITSPFRR
ncbi:MAG: hypothetical protein QM808_03995 [Steroidobacteraceae bacterium]